ncbi:FG-GAP-like repeat-containing protein [Streptomyces sp. NPDC090025]|uniref:FG-GAP-like repeat-containing protein n=1 Tax=Streptomyces sp. NPDC090025 TaxID=3365922 RepID=UPI0038368A13
MKRTTALAVGLSAALGSLFLSTVPAAAAPQPTPPLVRIMPLGDSITSGENAGDHAGYRARLWDLMAGQSRYTPDYVGTGSSGNLQDADHEGHSGWTIEGTLPRITEWQKAADPDVILLHLGINDLRNDGTTPERAAERMTELLDTIYANQPRVTVIVQGLIIDTPSYREETSLFNGLIRDQQRNRRDHEQRFTFVDAPRYDVATELPDGVHPNDAGYQKMAQTYDDALEQAVTIGWASRERAPRAGTEAGGTGPVRWADFDGDGRNDRFTIADGGAVNTWLNRGGSQGGGWQALGQVAWGTTNDRTRARLADFDGDGRADYWAIQADGSVRVWLNEGGDVAGPNGWKGIGQVAFGTTNRQDQVRLADFDGDGRADYTVISDNGAVNVWLNRGGDGAGANGWRHIGQVASGVTNDRSRVRFADIDGDGRADYSVIAADGKVATYLNRGGDGHGGWHVLGQLATGVTTDHTRVELSDFDGDGHADYLVNGPGGAAGRVEAWIFDGGDPAGAHGWIGQGTVFPGN